MKQTLGGCPILKLGDCDLRVTYKRRNRKVFSGIICVIFVNFPVAAAQYMKKTQIIEGISCEMTDSIAPCVDSQLTRGYVPRNPADDT